MLDCRSEATIKTDRSLDRNMMKIFPKVVELDGWVNLRDQE